MAANITAAEALRLCRSIAEADAERAEIAKQVADGDDDFALPMRAGRLISDIAKDGLSLAAWVESVLGADPCRFAEVERVTLVGGGRYRIGGQVRIARDGSNEDPVVLTAEGMRALAADLLRWADEHGLSNGEKPHGH